MRLAGSLVHHMLSGPNGAALALVSATVAIHLANLLPNLTILRNRAIILYVIEIRAGKTMQQP